MRIQSSPHLESAGVQTIVLHCLLNCPDSQVIRTKALRSSLNMSILYGSYGGIGLTFMSSFVHLPSLSWHDRASHAGIPLQIYDFFNKQAA